MKTAVSSSTGYSTAILNVGQQQNSGIEILLKGTPIKTKNFTWDISGTFSHNNNKINLISEFRVNDVFVPKDEYEDLKNSEKEVIKLNYWDNDTNHKNFNLIKI